MDTDIPWTVVAPSYYYENTLGARAAIREDRLPIALPNDKPLHQVALAELRHRSEDLASTYEFLAGEGYGIDTAALRDRYPEVSWTSFADWARSINW
jgi:hypothetical protein